MHKGIVAIMTFGLALLVSAAVLSATRVGGNLATWLLVAGGLAWTAAVVFSWRHITGYLMKRSTRYGANALVLSLLVLIILFLIGFVAERHPWRRDFTAAGEFTLSEKTLNVLEGLAKPIDIYVYYERSASNAVRDLLTEYVRRNHGLRVRMEDLNKDPERAERFGVRELGTIVFDAGDKLVILKTFGEEDVTNALIKASRPDRRKVYFVTDHGEKDLEDKGVFGYTVVRNALLRENYEPAALSISNAGGIPADCDVLVVAGPKSGYLEQELLAIGRYLEDGGRLLGLFDPRFTCGLEGYLGTWGIAVGDDRVIDTSPTGQLLGKGPTTPMVNRYGVHAITRQFRQPTYFPSVRSVRRQTLYRGLAETAALAFSSEQSWAERDLQSRQISYDETDLPGPISVAMASKLDLAKLEDGAGREPPPGDATVQDATLDAAGGHKSTETRLVVFGDSDFATNTNFNDMGNGNLFLNAVAWLSEDEDLIALRPRRASDRSISLSQRDMRMLNVVSVGGLPALVALAGVIATLRRRSRG